MVSGAEIVVLRLRARQVEIEDAIYARVRDAVPDPGEAGYLTNASFAPWSGNAAFPASTEFDIDSGPNGGPCPNPPGDQGGGGGVGSNLLPFAPSLASGTTNNNAGSFSNLTTTLSRPSGDQNIQSVTLHYPAGLSGILTGVPLCPEAQANAGTCSEASEIGQTIVSVGLGGDPFTVTGGKVYLTEKYDGAPFGLSIVNPAKAGPFDLQEGRPVVVRAKPRQRSVPEPDDGPAGRRRHDRPRRRDLHQQIRNHLHDVQDGPGSAL
jgi:hypothetical protein